MNIFEKKLNKLTKQELVNLCVDIKKSSEQKTEIIRNLEKKFCACSKSDKVNYGHFEQCLDCGLPMSGWWKNRGLYGQN